MQKIVKTILSLAFWTLLVSVVTFFLIFSTVNPNHFRNLISKQVNNYSDYNMTIDGNLLWEFWPSLLIESQNVTIKKKNASQLQPFLTAKVISISADSNKIIFDEGKIFIKAENGEISGVDVPAILHAIEEMLVCMCLVSVPTGGQTHFSKLTASLSYFDKVLENNDLLLKGDDFSLTGTGTVANFATKETNYNLVLHLHTAKNRQEEPLKHFNNIPIPIHCSGSIQSPRCIPKMNLILEKILTLAIKEKFKKSKRKVEGNTSTEIQKTIDKAKNNLENTLKKAIKPKKILQELFTF
jgi:uncharacterized protein involved in outer membrane biogenesis